MAGIVGDQAEGLTFDADKAGQQTDPIVRPQFEHRTVVGHGLDDGAHVIHTQAILWNQMPQAPLINCRPARRHALEKAQQLTRGSGRFALIGTGDIDHAIGGLHIDGADILRFEFA